jgi:hypothetical protein
MRVIGLLVVTAVIGVLVLGGLAVWVGVIEGRALDRAWRRVAIARQGLAQRISHLNERESAVVERERDAELREAFLRSWESRLRDDRDAE